MDAYGRAHAVRAAHRPDGIVSDGALDGLLSACGLRVVEGCAFTGRVREVYAHGLLGIRAGVPPDWTRWLKVHGLGYHLLHHGNHLYAANGLHVWQQQEIEAEVFTGTILLGDLVSRASGLPQLARLAGVPLECVHSWQASMIYAHEDGLRLSRA